MNSYSTIPQQNIINKESYLFLYSLLKSIFIIDTENRKEKNNKLEEFMKIIKEKYEIELRREYSKENFENIIKFVKAHNVIYGGEILENILLKLFSSIMKIPQKETINKYIYYNLQNVFGIKNKMIQKQIKEVELIQNFISYDRIYPDELKNKDIFFQIPYTPIPTDFEYFLTLIYKLKLDSVKNEKNKFNDITHKLFEYSKKYHSGKEEKNIIQNSIIEFDSKINQVYENYNKNKQDNFINQNISVISYFFFTLFVNYQTINSRLIKFSNKKKDKLSSVPYEINFMGSSMKGIYASLMFTPMRQDNRINIISMAENDFAELGMLEMGKTIVFNPHLKVINYSKNRLYSHYFYYFSNASKIFDNNSVEEINLYNNFFKDDIDDYLCDILKKFKNLKTLNLSNNRIGSGISKFCNRLNLYYRQKKTKLERLNLNKCTLNKSSLYELCECLKSKSCKLKYLYLNINYINDFNSEPLLIAIKKNNSLRELYLSRNFIGNSSTQNIGKVISRFRESLEVIYLNQNEIKNNDNLLRIASRTKVVYSSKEDRNKLLIKLDENPSLKNLDLSKNAINIRNKKQILLLEQIINDTYLSCFDYSLILQTFDPDPKKENYENNEFSNEKKELIEKIKNIKDERDKIFSYIDEMKSFEDKYYDLFREYIDNEDLNDILVETVKDSPSLLSLYEDIDNLISFELLEIIGKTDEDLLNDQDYYFTKNLIKYMLLYKVNGGLINQWLKGLNKCLIII